VRRPKAQGFARSNQLVLQTMMRCPTWSRARSSFASKGFTR
jgi:hypothetical protein